MTPANTDTASAIESLETLLKAKIRLQDAQAEAQPGLEILNLLFAPEALNEDQKNVLRNGLKSLRKLLEAHTAYGDAVQQAEPARAVVDQLFGLGQPKPTANGKADRLAEAEAAKEPEVTKESEAKTKEPEAKAKEATTSKA